MNSKFENKRKWPSKDFEEEDSSEREDLELEDLLNALLRSQKELLSECMKLSDKLSQLHIPKQVQE